MNSGLLIQCPHYDRVKQGCKLFQVEMGLERNLCVQCVSSPSMHAQLWKQTRGDKKMPQRWLRKVRVPKGMTFLKTPEDEERFLAQRSRRMGEPIPHQIPQDERLDAARYAACQTCRWFVPNQDRGLLSKASAFLGGNCSLCSCFMSAKVEILKLECPAAKASPFGPKWHERWVKTVYHDPKKARILDWRRLTLRLDSGLGDAVTQEPLIRHLSEEYGFQVSVTGRFADLLALTSRHLKGIPSEEFELNLAEGAINPPYPNSLQEFFWGSLKEALELKLPQEVRVPQLTLLCRPPIEVQRLGPYIVVHAPLFDDSTRTGIKGFPAGFWVEVIRTIVEETDLQVVLVGRNAENTPRLYHWPTSRVCNLVDRMNLDSLVGTIGGATALVTNDSGPMHLGVGLRIPTLSYLTGFTRPEWVQYPVDWHTIVSGVNVPCSGDYGCWQRACLRQIPSVHGPMPQCTCEMDASVLTRKFLGGLPLSEEPS